MSKRFDVEQGILNCWNIIDDIKLIYETVGNKGMSEDELMNTLIGLESLYKMKFEKLFDDFEQLM
jgi:hypothetical protein